MYPFSDSTSSPMERARGGSSDLKRAKVATVSVPATGPSMWEAGVVPTIAKFKGQKKLKTKL